MTPEQQYVSEKKIFWEVQDGADLTVYPADQIVDELTSRIEMEHAHIAISRVEMTQAEFDRLVCYDDDEDESDPRYLERLAHVTEMERIGAEQTAAQNNPLQQGTLLEEPSQTRPEIDLAAQYGPDYMAWYARVTEGVRCSACKRTVDAADGGWRWTGRGWGHKCPE